MLTRNPASWRLRPTDAHRLLESTFRGKALLVGLDGDEAWDLLDDIELTVAHLGVRTRQIEQIQAMPIPWGQIRELRPLDARIHRTTSSTTSWHAVPCPPVYDMAAVRPALFRTPTP